MRLLLGPVFLSLLTVVFTATESAASTVYYVSPAGGHAHPYSSWSMAATNIQSAVDACLDGDTVWVTNGTYLLSSEVVVASDIVLQSVNGPEATIINGGGVVRCLNLGRSACTVSGFTLTHGNGSTRPGRGGGVYCTDTTPVVTNCTISGNTAWYSGGGMHSGTAKDCTISGNTATFDGGGVSFAMANSCTISGNTAGYGGGMRDGTANNCTIRDNTAFSGGGGLSYVTANNCTISGNSSDGSGGGMYRGTANNCTISGNVAAYGGGMRDGVANNCIIYYNTASISNDVYGGSQRHTCSPGVAHGVDGNLTNVPSLVSASHIAPDSVCLTNGSSDYVLGTDIDGEPWRSPPSMGCDEHHGPGSVTGAVSMALLGPTLVRTDGTYDYTPVFNGPMTQTVVKFGDDLVTTNWSGPFSMSWSSPRAVDVVMVAYNDTYVSGLAYTQTITVVDPNVHVSDVAGDDANDGLSWATAKKTIQAGVDATPESYSVWVTNGTYLLSSEIVVAKDIVLQSVNGPEATRIDGGGSVRCLNLGGNACVVSGFTLTNGLAKGTSPANWGGGVYCTDSTPMLTNCTISGNTASFGDGGGMYFGTADNCTIRGNNARHGGGMHSGTARNCEISGNTANYGGGVRDGTAHNCTISGNTSDSGGGGVAFGAAHNCTISDNTAFRDGGGMYFGTANNCTVSGNSSGSSGGGMYSGTASNCTITGNGAEWKGGGISRGPAYNSIVYYNTAGTSADVDSGTLHYSCSPHVADGVDGNLTNAPSLLTPSHIAPGSICRGRGSSAYASGTDIDGEAWRIPPSIGCDEYHGPGTVTGDVRMELLGPSRVGAGRAAEFTPQFFGPLTQTVVDFGNGLVLTNGFGSVSTLWSSTGTVDVVLTAYNDAYALGLACTQTIMVANATVYVSDDGGNDSNDGQSWATAKQTIQAGVDAAPCNGVVLVTNGTYLLASEIVVTKEIVLQSVNGPDVTIIDGGGAVRCLNLEGTACVVNGFTVTKGLASGALLSESRGGGVYCSTDTPVITNCTIRGNVADLGGGGIRRGTAHNCTISGNTAGDSGGGMSFGRASNCMISGNIAVGDGGGLHLVTAINCTVSGNTAGNRGGGMCYGGGSNCIVYHNAAGTSNDVYGYMGAYSYNCSPDLGHGIDGNLTNAPTLLSPSHIAPDSICRGRGRSAFASGTDIDGEPWQTPPSIGCDEFHGPGTVTGDVSMELSGPSRVGAGRAAEFAPRFFGPLTQTVVDFGNGLVLTNGFGPVSTLWSSTGTVDVVLTAYSDTYVSGLAYTQTITALSPTVYVSGADGDDGNDGRTWATAKQTIQAGVDAAPYNGEVLVTNGTYLLASEIVVAKGIDLQSVNGPEVTIIDGGGAVRCLNLGGAACVVSGFTVSNGLASGTSPADLGGGIYCTGLAPAVIANCTIISNAASGSGGGMYLGTANNCVVSGNIAVDDGGGLHSVTANNCTIIGNSASSGGGLRYGTAINCTIIGNSADDYAGGMSSGAAYNSIISYNSASIVKDAYSCTLQYACSTDASHGVDGNITNLPAFVDRIGGDYRLALSSPCIDAGDIGYVTWAYDLAGNPRIQGASVDMGAYEFIPVAEPDADGDGIPDAYELAYSGSITGLVAAANEDGDVHNNLEEYIAGTDPTNSASFFRVTEATDTTSGFLVEWAPSLEGRWYTVNWTNRLAGGLRPLAAGIEFPQNRHTDTVHAAETFGSYQVEVELK